MGERVSGRSRGEQGRAGASRTRTRTKKKNAKRLTGRLLQLQCAPARPGGWPSGRPRVLDRLSWQWWRRLWHPSSRLWPSDVLFRGFASSPIGLAKNRKETKASHTVCVFQTFLIHCAVPPQCFVLIFFHPKGSRFDRAACPNANNIYTLK